MQKSSHKLCMYYLFQASQSNVLPFNSILTLKQYICSTGIQFNGNIIYHNSEMKRKYRLSIIVECEKA